MDNPDLSCTVCEEKYGDNRHPRILNCGHSICTVCLQQIFHLDKLCPECRRTISGKNASELPVNYTVLRLARSFPYHHHAKKAKSTGASADSEVQTEAGKCKVHGSHLFFMCMKCQMWICRDCTVLDHREPPRGRCRILSASDALKEIKESYKKNEGLFSYSCKAKQIKEMIDTETTLLGFKENSLRAKHRELQSEMKAIEEGLQDLQPHKDRISTRKSQLKEMEDMMDKAKVSIDQATTIKELETIKKKNAHRKRAFENFLKMEKDKFSNIGRILLKDSHSVLTTLKAVVYATSKDNGRNRWSKVATRDDQLLLYSMREGNQPSDGLVIPYDCIRELVPSDSPTIFMEVSWNGEFRGCVYVKMFGNTPRSRQTTFLCSGEQGPSFRNTAFSRYVEEDVYNIQGLNCIHTDSERCSGTNVYNLLRLGDYQNNYDSVDRDEGVDAISYGRIYTHEVVAGLMVSWPVNRHWPLGASDFYLKDTPKGTVISAHGMVTHGLEILLEAAKVKPITSVSVTDCGLVIPL